MEFILLIILVFLLFVGWLLYAAFTVEDPALTMHQDENWYEDEDEDDQKD